MPHLLQRDSYYVYTQQELKEKLYQEIISYFDKGKVSAGFSVFFFCTTRRNIFLKKKDYVEYISNAKW